MRRSEQTPDELEDNVQLCELTAEDLEVVVGGLEAKVKKKAEPEDPWFGKGIGSAWGLR
jgi:hypothetical protein